ncbi:MAG TPA: NUDIX domain-containing protein, partial [Longimicrobiales bacterium]|nr:NUDIX domain-containing protein [Longimicrobiales bacterium]
RHGGRLPDSYEALRALPGVGEYTAGAVARIAFGEAVPAVDGNVKRVLARLHDEPSPGAAWLRRTAAELVDRHRPGDWNQALMELGATVCTPANPGCTACPVARWCKARAAGTQAERPAPPRKKDVPTRTFVVAVVVDARGRALVVRRPDDGLLAGMWAFPDVPLEDGEGDGAREAPRARSARTAADALQGVALRVGPGAWPRDLPEVRHRFTHLDATYQPVLLAGEGSDAENRRWIALAEPWPVALPVAQQKIARSAAAAFTNDE